MRQSPTVYGRHWLPLLPTVLVPPLLWLFADGVPRVAPCAPVGPAAAACFALWCWTGEDQPHPADVAMIGLMALAAGHVLLVPGFPLGHDAHHHLWGIWAVFKTILDGEAYPRWIHHLGLGMPFLEFYPPGAFLLVMPFLPSGLAPAEVLKAGLLLYSGLSGCSMYWAVARWTASRRAALVASLAYVWSPYMLLDSHYRVALAECASFIFLPLFFGHTVRALREPRRRTIAWAALSTALLLITHPISAVVAAVGMIAWITAEWWPLRFGVRQWVLRCAVFGLIGLSGAAAGGFFTVPLVVEAKYTSLSQGIARDESEAAFTRYGVRPAELLAPRRWSRMQLAQTTGSEADRIGDEMPYYFGLALLALVPLAAGWANGERKRADCRAPLGLVVVTIVGLVLTLRPLDQILGRLSLFSVVQFPWRFLMLATFGASACAGFATVRLGRMVQHVQLRRMVPGVLGALLIFDAFPYSGAPSWGPDYHGIAYLAYRGDDCGRPFDCWEARAVGAPPVLRAEGILLLPPSDYATEISRFGFVYPELYTPAVWEHFFKKVMGPDPDPALVEAAVGWSFSGRGEKPRVIEAKPYAEFRESGTSAAQALEFIRKAGRITVEIPGEAGVVVVREQWFPGWMVRTRQGWSNARSTPEGFLYAETEAGARAVEFKFSNTRPDHVAGWVLSFLTLLALFAPMRLTARRCRSARH